MTKEEFDQKLIKQTVYLLNEHEGIVIRSEPNGDFFAKIKGYKEYKIDHDTDTVYEAILDQKEITKEEYEKY